MIYPKPKVIFVDVDGVLLKNGIIDQSVVEWCKARHAAGFSLSLWSSAGEDHAIKSAELAGITGLFHNIMSKPGYVLDDNGWRWTRLTQEFWTIEEANAFSAYET